MNYQIDFKSPKHIQKLALTIARKTTKHWTLMEVCGGQTHAIAQYALESMLPDKVEIIHGPGCPVCVTPIEMIDKAITLSKTKDVIVCTFGDMFRVPGSSEDLLTAKAKGGTLKMVYSPMDALTLAQENPDKQVVFFGVGFETTAPANAMAIFMAKKRNIENFSVLCSHVLVPPGLKFILDAPDNRVQAFLAAGHVCTVMGFRDYDSITKNYHVPIVVTGFEPCDILQGILAAISQLEEGKAFVENQYTRCVKPVGNIHAKHLIDEIFEIHDFHWRGLGLIPNSGFKIKSDFAHYDALLRFKEMKHIPIKETSCISAQILTGKKKPQQCPAFGKQCTPEAPLGAPMVSTEGACSAYYQYQPEQT